MKLLPGFVLVVLLMITACTKDNESPKEPVPDITIITGQGDINPKLNEFRQILGITINTTPGAVGGHREINWDALPAEVIGKALPVNFFNTVGTNVPASRQRGLVYGAESGEFRVSATNFADVNSAAAPQFSAFSGERTFANISSTLWNGSFEVPGQQEAATVRGFGMVFSDVDKNNSTFIEFFNGNQSLGKFFVPVHNDQSSFSFLGVHFKTQLITSFRVGHEGTLASGEKDITDGGNNDLVIMDDFFYDEPVKKN